MKNQIPLIIAVVFCSVVLFGFDIQRAYAINVMTITAPASSIVNEGAYQIEGLTTNKAYLVGQQNGANGTIYIKNHNSATTGSDSTDTTINLNNLRSGTSNAHTVVYVPRTNSSLTFNQWLVLTNLGGFSFSDSTDTASQNVAQGAWALVDKCIFVENGGRIYCLDTTNDFIYAIDPEDITGSILDKNIDTGTFTTTVAFAIDETSRFLFVSGSCTVGTVCVQRYNIDTLQKDYDINGVTGCTTVSGVAVDTRDDIFWISCSDGSAIKKFNQDGSLIGTFTSISTPRYMQIDSVARRLYVASETTDQVQIFDIDSNAPLSTQSVCNYQQTTPLDIRRQTTHIKVFIPCTGTSHSQLIDDSSAVFPLEEEEEETPFCELPENENILICRMGGDGTLGSAGAFVIGNTTSGTGLLGIGCSIGLVDCTEDSNPQTNGLGLLIFIASIFVIVGMFFRTLGGSATFQLPIFIWVVLILALSAFFTITGLIDPVFLILSVIALIALASPKIINIIRGSTFGGGSTE